MASSGVSYIIGREANTHYGETMNGVELKYSKRHQFINRIDPFQIPGDQSSEFWLLTNKSPKLMVLKIRKFKLITFVYV